MLKVKNWSSALALPSFISVSHFRHFSPPYRVQLDLLSVIVYIINLIHSSVHIFTSPKNFKKVMFVSVRWKIDDQKVSGSKSCCLSVVIVSGRVDDGLLVKVSNNSWATPQQAGPTCNAAQIKRVQTIWRVKIWIPKHPAHVLMWCQSTTCTTVSPNNHGLVDLFPD